MRRIEVERGGRDAVRPRRGGAAPTNHLVFRYELRDLAGREVGHLEHEGALRAGDEILVGGSEEWRVVAVLGVSATVTRSVTD